MVRLSVREDRRAFKNGKPTETGKIDEEKRKSICVGHHYMQTNTNNVNKTRTLLQTTGGKSYINNVWRDPQWPVEKTTFPALSHLLLYGIKTSRHVVISASSYYLNIHDLLKLGSIPRHGYH
jgi:hypothetical protein